MQVTGRRARLIARATTVAGGPVDWIVRRRRYGEITMNYHFPMLTLEEAAQEGLRLFGAQPKSVHFRICAACVGAANFEEALRKVPLKTADDMADAADCADGLRQRMDGHIPYALDQYTDRPEREIRNPFAHGLQEKRGQLELAI